MKFAFIGTYPPRECGIGTFTNNLLDSVLHTNKADKHHFEAFVVAVNDHNLTYDYPQEVKLRIRQELQEDYLKAAKSKEEFKLVSRKVLLTFGFIGRNKGIETVINALPDVIQRHPDVVYIILGRTHPNVLRHSGEEYRIFLMRLVKKLQLEN